MYAAGLFCFCAANPFFSLAFCMQLCYNEEKCANSFHGDFKKRGGI